MPPHAFLSPYLRPVLQPGAAGQRTLFDDAATGRLLALRPAEEQVVRALWGAEDGAALAWLEVSLGSGALRQALQGLRRRGLIFDDRAACDARVNAAVIAALEEVPCVDQVELTNACPMQCGFCVRGVRGRISRPVGFMEFATFERLLDQLPKRQRSHHPLELNNFGESLLHPQVARFIGAAGTRGLATELSVNPTLLTAELGRAILDAGLSRLVVSLDGMDDATLASVRGPAAVYSRSERNLDAFLGFAAGRAQPPDVVIQMIDLARNRHQHGQFLERWGRLGLSFTTAYIKGLDGPDPETGQESATPVRYLCTYPFHSVVVLWDGRVVPCCRDPDAAVVLGSVARSNLGEAWRGEVAQSLRAAWLGDAFPEGHLCSTCPWRRGRFARAVSERHPDRAVANPLHW